MPSGEAGRMLLVGGAGPSPLGIDIAVTLIAQAASRGLRTHIIGRDSDLASTRQVCELADDVSVVDFLDTGASVDWAVGQEKLGHRFDIVFSMREVAQVTTAEIAGALGVAGNPPEAIRLVNIKDACRQHLAAAGFRQPRMTLCRDDREAERALADIGGPCVVKPRSKAGSEGVSLVTGPADLAAALQRLPGDEPLLVEEFVEGAEYSVEGLFRQGRPEILAITAKDKFPPPGFIERGHALPAALPRDEHLNISETVRHALLCAGLRFGLFHAELWLTPHGVVMGELHARQGGDFLHLLLSAAIPGLEMFGDVFDDALGRPPLEVTYRPTRAAAIRYLAPPPGRLESLTGWQRASSHPAVLMAELKVAPGDEIVPYASSDDRVAAIAVGADTVEDATRLAWELTESVRFTVRTEPG
jgi:biotin carboxylase